MIVVAFTSLHDKISVLKASRNRKDKSTVKVKRDLTFKTRSEIKVAFGVKKKLESMGIGNVYVRGENVTINGVVQTQGMLRNLLEREQDSKSVKIKETTRKRKGSMRPPDQKSIRSFFEQSQSSRDSSTDRGRPTNNQ